MNRANWEKFGYPVEGLSLIAACFPSDWKKAEVYSDVFFVEGLIAVDEIQPGLPTLAFPEGIALLVAGIHKHASSVDPFTPQSLTGSICELLSDALALVFGQNNGVVNIAAPAVVPGQDAANNLTGNFCYKTSGGISL